MKFSPNITSMVKAQKIIRIDLVAAKIDLTESEYLEIENGIRKLDILQAAKLGDLYDINPSHLLELAESINYNIGSYSRTIYTDNYIESKEEKN